MIIGIGLHRDRLKPHILIGYGGAIHHHHIARSGGVIGATGKIRMNEGGAGGYRVSPFNINAGWIVIIIALKAIIPQVEITIDHLIGGIDQLNGAPVGSGVAYGDVLSGTAGIPLI